MRRHLFALSTIIGLLLILTVTPVSASEVVNPQVAYSWRTGSSVGGQLPPCLGGGEGSLGASGLGAVQVVFDEVGAPSLNVRQRLQFVIAHHDPALPTYEASVVVHDQFPLTSVSEYSASEYQYSFSIPVTMVLRGSDGSVASVRSEGYSIHADHMEDGVYPNAYSFGMTLTCL